MIRRLGTSLFAVVAVLLVSALCFAESPVTRHTREATLNGQAPLVGHLPSTQSMRLTLVLPLRNHAELESFLKDLYDPSSSSYRKFLTVEQFTERFGPTRDDYNTVMRFARDNGFKVVQTARNRVNVDVIGTVDSIERAFHVTMGLYQHPTENRTFYAPDREPTPDMGVQLWRIAGLDN
jgi:subtilase family serine protease